jgi:hypothetical protein
MHRRNDHHSHVYFGADRVHYINGEWYFLTREGAGVGPFPSKHEAKNQLSIFLFTFEMG